MTTDTDKSLYHRGMIFPDSFACIETEAGEVLFINKEKIHSIGTWTAIVEGKACPLARVYLSSDMENYIDTGEDLESVFSNWNCDQEQT